MAPRGRTGGGAVDAEEHVDETEIAETVDAGDDELDPDAGEDRTGDDESELDDETGGDDDATGEDEGEGDGSPEVRQTRGQRDYGRLRAERRAEKERADRLERELAEARRGAAPQQDQSQAIAQRRATELEAARLEGPDKYVEVALRHKDEDVNARFSQIEIATLDARDRGAFEADCRRNPVLAKIADEVEERLAEERRRGLNFPRSTVARFVLGDRALRAGSKIKGKARRQEDIERRRETVRAPSGGRSDVARESGRGGSDQEKRYNRIKDLQI